MSSLDSFLIELYYCIERDVSIDIFNIGGFLDINCTELLLDDCKSSGAEADKSKQRVDLLLVSSPEPVHEEVLSMYFEKFSPTAKISKHGDNHWILKFDTQSGEIILCYLWLFQT